MPSRFPLACLFAVLSFTTGCLSTAPQAPTASQTTEPGASRADDTASANVAPVFAPRQLESALHRAVNQARQGHDLQPLVWSDSLHRLARRHSRDMAQRSYFGHVTPEGQGPAYRARHFGFATTRPLDEGRRIGIGENLFRTYRYDSFRDVYRQSGGNPRRHVRREYDWKTTRALAQETVESWLQSPPHRRALLSPHYQRHGLGVAVTEDYQVYITQNLF